MRIKKWTGILLVLLIGGLAFAAEQNKGEAEIILDGGRTGKIDFPHARHQAALNDCNICHDKFPQKKGAIESLKEAGKLKKQSVMKTCQKCHRKMARANQKTGPTGCKKCHSIKN